VKQAEGAGRHRILASALLGTGTGLLLLAVAHQLARPETPERTEVVAAVDGKPILWDEIAVRLAELDPIPDDRPYALVLGALDDLVRRQILHEEALEAGLEVTTDQARRICVALPGRDPMGTDEEADEEAVWLRRIAEDMEAMLLAEHMLPESSEPEEGELRRVYEERPHLFWREGRVRLRRAQWTEFESAQQAEKRLRAGSSFLRIAEGAQGPEAADRGEIGWVSRSELAPHIADELFALAVGRRSGIIKGPMGYAIYLVQDKEEGGLRPYEEVRDEIRSELRARERVRRFEEWYALSRERHEVIIDLASLVRAMERGEK